VSEWDVQEIKQTSMMNVEKLKILQKGMGLIRDVYKVVTFLLPEEKFGRVRLTVLAVAVSSNNTGVATTESRCYNALS